MFKSYLLTSVLLVLFLQCVNAQESEIRHDGILLPSLTEIEMAAILSPDEGHAIYNSDTNSIWYFNGTSWADLRIDPASTSPLEIDGTLIRQKGGYANIDFIIGRDALPDNSAVTDKFFMFDKNKGAMRGGELIASDRWKPLNIGSSSFAWGLNVQASGDFSSIALGHSSEASGNYGSIALGSLTQATGDNGAIAIGAQVLAHGRFGSTAIGYVSQSRGNNGAIALGHGLRAYGDSGTAVGTYNDPIVSIAEPLSPTSPIFMVGNGDATSRSNALVVYKNGNTSVEGPLTAESSAEIKGVLLAQDNLVVNGDAILSQNVQVSGNMGVSGPVNLYSGLDVTGDVLMNDKLDVSGEVNMAAKLTVVNSATFEDLVVSHEGIKFKAIAAPGLCNVVTEGRVYYNAVTKKLKFCDGTSWLNLH